MAKGTLYPAESVMEVDARTNASIRRITSAPAIHHHPFFMMPAYDDAMQWTVFASSRTGKPQIFAEVRATGELLQLTDRDDLGDWSIHPSHDGRYVYFTAGSGGWRVHIPSGKEEQLVDLRELVPAPAPARVASHKARVALPCASKAWWAQQWAQPRSAMTTAIGR